MARTQVNVGDAVGLFITTGHEVVNGRKKWNAECSACGWKTSGDISNIRRKKFCPECEARQRKEVISEKPKAVKEDANGICITICPDGEFDFVDAMVKEGSSVNAAAELFVQAVKANVAKGSPSLVGLNVSSVKERYRQATKPDIKVDRNLSNTTSSKSLDNIHPLLARYVLDGFLDEPTALEYSVLPESAQASIAKQIMRARDEAKRSEDSLAREKASKNEIANADNRAMKAISAKEVAEKNLEDSIGKSAQEAVETAKAETLNLKGTLRQQIEEEQAGLIEKRVRDEFGKELDKAHREIKTLKEKRKLLVDDNLREQALREEVEAIARGVEPSTKDKRFALELKDLQTDIKGILIKSEDACFGYRCPELNKELHKTTQLITNHFDSQPEIIEG